MRRLTNEEFITRVNDIVGDEYTFLEDYKKSAEPIKVRHNVCGNEYTVKPNNFFSGKRCRRCSIKSRATKRALGFEEFKARLSKVHGEGYEIKSEYTKLSAILELKHKECGYEFKEIPVNLLSGSGCPICVKGSHLTEETFKYKLNKTRGSEFIYVGGFKNTSSKVFLKHIQCGRIIEVIAGDILYGQQGCGKCNSKTRKTNDIFLEEVKKEVGDEYTFLEEYKTTHVPLKVRHNKCGREYFVRPSNFIFLGHRCGACRCKRSRGEVAVMNELVRLDQEFEEERRIGGILRADFYLTKYKAYIEFDGRQHYDSIEFWGGDAELEGIKFRDGVKDAYCRLQGIPLLRIPYWEFDNIPQIVTEFIEELEEERKKRKEDDLLDGE